VSLKQMWVKRIRSKISSSRSHHRNNPSGSPRSNHSLEILMRNRPRIIHRVRQQRKHQRPPVKTTTEKRVPKHQNQKKQKRQNRLISSSRLLWLKKAEQRGRVGGARIQQTESAYHLNDCSFPAERDICFNKWRPFTHKIANN
jgi:hypothetical protein